MEDVITELCKIPNAQYESKSVVESGSIIEPNPLDEVEADQSGESNPQHPRPDHFCIHQVDGTTDTLLTTVEYKPLHKRSVENLRVGLRPMEFWGSGTRSLDVGISLCLLIVVSLFLPINLFFLVGLVNPVNSFPSCFSAYGRSR